MELLHSPTTIHHEPRDVSEDENRIERIVSKRTQECTELEEAIKAESQLANGYIEDFERTTKEELSAIDAEMAILVKRRKNVEAYHTQYREKVQHISESYLSPLKERLDHLERLNRLQRSLRAPITRLPVELLGYIFETYVEMDKTPCMLVLVGPVWRRVALSTPKLWRHILVTNEASLPQEESWEIGGDVGLVSSYGRYVVCRTSARVISTLPLSKTVSLYISLRIRGSLTLPSGDPELPLDELLGEQTSHRLGELEIKMNSTGTYPIPLSWYMKKSDFPLLRAVVIDETGSDWDMGFMRQILASPNLTNITFQSQISREVAGLSGWSSVLHLSFPPMSIPDNLNQFCSQLRNLQTLNGTASNWPNEDTPKIRFDFLEEVTLKCKPTYLHHLTLPSLTKLDLSIAPEWTPSTPNRPASYTLPALTNLCLTLTSDAGPYLPPQSSIPALDTLTIVNVGKCQTLPPEIYPSVRSIQLEGSGSTNYYACAFNAAPNAHSITIIASKYERNAISNALQLLADTRNPEGLYLAFASQFYLGSTSKPVFSKTRILPFVKQLLTNRQTIGNPPTVLDVVWSAQRTRPTGLESYVKTRR